MACTTQSARDCIQNARPHLVGHLKNLSVIVENLHQQEVFTGEEVSIIEAESNDYDKTRKILDLVINKGEDACYLLLRIIDMTRKRTLERLPLLPVKRRAVSAETKEFDPHHWISCFPFKEDAQMDINYFQGPRPCHRFQAKLKSKAQKLSREFWMKSKNLFEENNKPDLRYTPLVLDTQGIVPPSKTKKIKSKKCRMSRPKKMRTYIPEDKREISPSDLLKTDKNILVVGKPGIGKTALSHELLKVWAERGGEELDYMFYFDMREAAIIRKDMSLEDLLFSVFTEEGKEDVLEDIKKNSDNVTVVFDGLTGLSSPVVQRLVKQDLLPDAKIIITCRPEDEEAFFSEDSLRVEVKGFSEQTIKTYLCATLGDKQKKVLSNVELFTLCHVPMYALMVAACCASHSPQPCTVTEIYINIVRFCLQINSNETNRRLNSFIKNKSKEILSLAEVAFLATEGKTVNLAELPCEDSCVFSFLKPLCVKAAITETETTYAFLHYTMQEFFAALWLLKSPDHIKAVFQQCLTEEKKHMKHLIPFMCRLLSEKSPSLMKCLIPAEELRNTSDWFFREMITTFFPCLCEYEEAGADDSGCDIDILFLCQCLYESQCPEACACLLDNLDYCLDLSGVNLDPYPCSAVAYVITQSKERKIRLNLEDTSVSEQGMRQLLGCLKHVQWCDPLTRQISKNFLLSEGQIGFDGNELHLPAEGETQLFERAVEVLQNMTTKVNVCLHWDRGSHACHSLCEALIQALPFIRSLSFRKTQRDPGRQDLEQQHLTLDREKGLLLDLCLKAVHKGENCGNAVNKLFSLFHVAAGLNDLLLVFYERLKTERCLNVLPSLRPLFQSIPSVWVIDLSKRKASILLEVLKLLAEKKHVKLTGCSHGESEVKSLLQCLPYISQLSFCPLRLAHCDGAKFLVNLFCAAAAEREQETGQTTLELLSSVCTDKTFLYNDIDDDGGDDDDDGDDDYKEDQCDFLLDLYSHLKDYETKTGLRVLPSLRPVVQSTPSVWVIDLSERKASILLEVLKLQTEKKHVELRGCSHGESEVKSFLQCLPYISQLSFYPWLDNFDGAKLLANLFCAAAEREQETGQMALELLSSVCTNTTFPFKDIDDDDDDYKKDQCDFLLDLYSHLKDYETKTGLRVLPLLQPLFQSTPSAWSIDFSKRKASILLEVLKLQAEKKRVELTGCSHGESEVKRFLQCLPYISQLSFFPWWLAHRHGAKFLANLFCAAAAEREQETGETTLELLSSVCTYETFPYNQMRINHYKEYQCDFLLDLYSHVKDYETKTGLRVLPSLRPVVQSTPSVWVIDLSERKASILLEVLKLQTKKKRVKLTGCSHGESEVKSFLQCLPYISQLRMSEESFQQLLALLCEIQDKDLTQSFLSKVDLTSHCLNWELLHYLLQQSAQPITVGLRKNPFLQESITHLLPFLDRIVFKRSSPSFVLTAIRELHRAQASHIIPSLVKSFDHVINLTCRELDSNDCAALLFTLTHSDRVHLNLTWTSIPAGETESILFTLDKVSQLSVDRTLLLRFVHCCAASDAQQEAAPGLLRTLQHQLDLSSSTSVELLEHGQTEPLSLTAGDCRAISTVLTHSSQDTELDLRDCEVQDGALDLLFPVLDRVHFRASKALVLQLVSLVPVNRERDTVRRAVSLCRALGRELDLSHTTLDQRSCGALALMLDHCEELTELDLSYCELTDQLLPTLATQLHKVQVLDLSHNEISDASAGTLLQLVSINPSIHTVRLFRNSIVDMSPFKKHQQFEIW